MAAKTATQIQVTDPETGYVFNESTTRQVTHAVVSTNYHGDRILVLTRSVKSALSNCRMFGDTNVTVIAL